MCMRIPLLDTLEDANMCYNYFLYNVSQRFLHFRNGNIYYERLFDMALQSLIDIANKNVDSYQERFERKSIEEKSKVNELKARLTPGKNMGITALLGTLENRFKSRFELCAENNGMTLDEFGKLPLDQQNEE